MFSAFWLLIFNEFTAVRRVMRILFNRSLLALAKWEVGGGGNPPLSSHYEVANTTTFLFEVACEHDKNIQKVRNILAEILHMIAQMLSASGGFQGALPPDSLTRTGLCPWTPLLAKPPGRHYYRLAPPPFSSFWICQ